MDYKIIKKLRELRKQKGITQEKLAEELDISRSKVSSWETNKREMSITEAIKLADLYDVSLDNLFERNNINEKEYIKVSDKFISNGKISLKEKATIIELIKESLKNKNIDELYENYIMTQNATK